MNKKLIASFFLTALLLMPVLVMPAVTFALTEPTVPGEINTTNGIWGIVEAVLSFVWPLFIGFAIIMLLVAGFLFLAANGDPGKVGTARMAVLWAIVGIVVGILAFSIPFLVQDTIL